MVCAPCAIHLTDDGLMIAGSETGMVHVDEAHILERGRLGPGEMIGVNLMKAALFMILS